MKRQLNAVMIGAGSANFGPITIYDLLKNTLNDGDTLALVDVDESAVTRMVAVTERMVSFFGKDIEVRGGTDRRDFLRNADVVIVAAEQDRIGRWKKDWEIPQQFGIIHTLGENRGPAGLSHTLRTVPLVLEMVEDVESIAPRATVLVMTNPEDRIAYAIAQNTSVRAFGYCDGLWDFKHNLVEKLLSIPAEQMFVEAAGINHAVWITAIRHYETGEDLYPVLVDTARKTGFEPFGLHLYDRFGLWPHENDEHYGEYFNYAHEYMECKGYDFDGHINEDREWKANAEKMLSGDLEIDQFVEMVARNAWDVLGDTPPSLTIGGLYGGQPQFIQNVNIQNNGTIPGLPDDIIVEVPGVALPSGVRSVGIHRLPEPILQFVHREGVIQKLAAEAAFEGSRHKALLALELDTHVPTNALAEKLLDAFLDEHEAFISRDKLEGLRKKI